ncbi:MAG TPA: hypothetical protein VFH36_13340 [Acidimicrobiales bacterium]|nr:hypothetical protein [Acidimicrobiales bacterium]
MAATTDPNLQAWRSAHGALGSRLVDLESLADVAVARTGILTGATAAAWAEADAGLAHAWETYRVLDQVLADAEAAPDRAAVLLTTASVPGAGGATADPARALEAASEAVDAAVAVADRLTEAWARLVPRVGAARTAAATAGDTATEQAAAVLAELVATDPFAVPDAQVAAVEQRAQASGSRHAAVQAAVGRLDADLDVARGRLATLRSDVADATTELAHAATRVMGVSADTPVPDLAELAAWLERIAGAAAAAGRGATDARARVANDLTGWTAAFEARRAELDARLAAARTRMRRRREGQGLWTALRAKAGTRRLDEQPDVADALTAAQDLLWHAPCDLAAAEAALARLSEVLTTRPKEDR